MDEIWKFASLDADLLDVSAEEKQLLDERWAEFLAAPEAALTITQFKTRLNQRAKAE